MMRISRNEILFGMAVLIISSKSENVGECKEGEWRCGDRSCAGVGAVCDGTLQCADGSDEALLLCKGTQRPLLGLILLCSQSWAPGHAVLCPEACHKWPEYCYYALFAEQGTPGTCVLPPFPTLGAYSITDITQRGGGPADFSLTYSCLAGYRLLGESPRCVSGDWTASFPRCIPASSSAVAAVYDDGNRACSEEEFPCGDGACVKLGNRCDGMLNCDDGSDERACAPNLTSKQCLLPQYPKHGTYSVQRYGPAIRALVMLLITCDSGYAVVGSEITYCFGDNKWTPRMPQCSQCGIPTSEGEQLITNGTSVKHGELPWHAGIYDKNYTPVMQICGGSLVSTTVVISAAHCFWSGVGGLQSPSRYAVGLGKIYRPWNAVKDPDVQKSDVSSIKVPVRFMGEQGHFQDDIALVILSTPAVYVTFIRPVCIDFDIGFDKKQLQDSNLGKVAGWGLTSEDGDASPVLKTTELPYVSVEKCIADLPYNFRSYITSDKICAGTTTGTALCKGDSGGGLAFPTVDGRGTQRYYLRGVVSTAPSSGHKCNANSYTSFTHILKHDTFIKDHLNNNS